MFTFDFYHSLSCTFDLVSTSLSLRKLKVNQIILYNSHVLDGQKSFARLFIVISCCVLFTDGVFCAEENCVSLLSRLVPLPSNVMFTVDFFPLA